MATITKRQYTSWQVSTADSRGTKIKKTFLCRTIAESFLEQLQQDGVSAKLSKATSLAWQARVRKKGFPPLTETFQTKAEAEAWSVAREAEMMQRRFVDYRAAERNTLGDLLRRYAEKVLATKPKSDPEHSRIRKLCRHPISNIAMHMLQKSDIAMYRDMRLEGGFVEPDDGRKLSVSARTWVKVKGSTVVKEMELISRIISLAIKEWDIHLPFNPASGNHCSRPAKHPTDERNRRLDDRQLGILEKSKDISVAHIEIKDFDMDETLIELVKKSPGELINLMRACRYPHWFRKNSSFKNCNKKIRRSIKSRDRKGLRLWAIVSFAIETAMRRSEILRLRWKDIKVEKSGSYLLLPATITKTRKQRVVPLSLRAVRILKTQPKTSDLVFDTNFEAVKSAFRRAKSRATIQDLRLHDLRHEATSRLYETTDLRSVEIGAITGHEDARSLRRYTNLRASFQVSRFNEAKVR